MRIGINKKNVLNIVSIVILCYFTVHSLYGSRGFLSYLKLKKELSYKYDVLNSLRSNRLKVENNAALLRTDSIDPDMLDEYSRKILGLVSVKDLFFNPEN